MTTPQSRNRAGAGALNGRRFIGWCPEFNGVAAPLRRRRAGRQFHCHQTRILSFLALLCGALVVGALRTCAASAPAGASSFPPPLESYADGHLTSLAEILRHRVQVEPLNLWASLLFLAAILHTFFTHKFRHWAHVVEARHRARQAASPAGGSGAPPACMAARALHFLGEVEVVFGLWAVPLFGLLAARLGQATAIDYVNRRVGYQEAIFVVVIMAIAGTRPILRLAEKGLQRLANLGGGRPLAWWVTILTVAPVLGSFITEPAAMTIAASLLARQFYELKPRLRLAYATLGLLFVNVSVGGVLTHFAAPPVLMVAGPWGWNTPFMIAHFGWVAVVGILVANGVYLAVFRSEFSGLAEQASQLRASAPAPGPDGVIPAWVTIGHLLFMGWSVWHAHHPALLIGGFLFFLAFHEVTEDYQGTLQLRSPILVGFFLAGLVIHGGLQQWWIAPVLGRLGEVPLLLGALGLTALNDNAAITYLATLVPGLTDGMKYAVVAGAVAGGGLTVIANAPNPAGQAILGRYFPDGISPLGLLLGALPATAILALCFLLLG